MTRRSDRFEGAMREELQQLQGASLEHSVLAAIGQRTPVQLLRDEQRREMTRATLFASGLWLLLVVLVLFLQSRADGPVVAPAPEETAAHGLVRWMDAPPELVVVNDESEVLTHLLLGERSP